MNPDEKDSVIRISKDDALSSHVDDLLKRQMNMRGDPGVTRTRNNAWYYQNWFVLGIVGLLGAVSAWAILNPMYEDLLYIQGPIASISDSSFSLGHWRRSHDESDINDMSMASVVIKGQTIRLIPETKEIKPDKSIRLLDASALKEGDEVGFYVEYRENEEGEIAVAVDAVRSPPPQSSTAAGRTLHQLAARKSLAGMLLFPTVAGLIGLFIGAADGLICRLPRRALLCGAVGLLVGFVGGFLSSIVAEIIYSPLTDLASRQVSASGGLTSLGFAIQVMGRSLAWCLTGSAMGLAQGIALRSKRLLIYGLLGGVVGGLLGGMLFDPIDMLLLGPGKPEASLSRLIGFAVIGLSVGGIIGVVELLARDMWLRMTQGPLTGKEFLIFKDVMNVGSSPRSDIYLFNDPLVAEHHALIRAVGDECEIEARQSASPVLLNNRSTMRARLRHGDNVTIGRTSFIFQQRQA